MSEETMLYSVDTGNYIDYIPHEREYRAWVGRLTRAEVEAIEAELNRMVEGDEIHTSSWMPGSDWSGTVFHPIYESACQQNEQAAGMCFGLMLWKVLMDRREDVWGFGHYEKAGVPIEGMTYFRIRNPPPR
jgi:hypothetical protein